MQARRVAKLSTEIVRHTEPILFLFLDDIRDPPVGATLCRCAYEAIRLIESGVVTRISFEHDLGTETTGYDVSTGIEQLMAEGVCWFAQLADPFSQENDLRYE